MRSRLRLDTPDESGVTLRAHLEQVWKQTGKKPGQLYEAPVPPALEHVWGWFLDLSRARTSGMAGPNPVGYGEIMSWARLSGTWPTAYEVDVLRVLDNEYLDFYSRRGKDKKPGDRE